MNDTGIVRRVDDLGRIVIPMELRRTLGIHVKDPISISVDGENAVTFSMSGAVTKGGNGWGFGPFPIQGEGAGLPTALDPLDHLLIMLTQAQVPAVSDDPVETPALLTSGTPAG